MTSDTPGPSSDVQSSADTPSRTPAAELLQGGTIPATAGTVSTSPKLPPFQGD